MWVLTGQDLRHRARRFVVVAVGASLVYTLLYVMTGLVEQFNAEPYLTADAIGGETWVLPAGVSGPFTSSAVLTVEQADAILGGGLAPIVVARGTLHVGGEPTEVVVVGHDHDGVGAPTPTVGSAAAEDGELVVDATAGAVPGTRVELGDEPFTVAGTTSDTTLLAGLPVVFVPIDAAREALFGGGSVVSAGISEDLDPGPLPAGVAVVSRADVAADALGPLENAVSSIDLIRGLLWFVAAVIIGGILYLTALERERDFAVVKAIGGTDRQLTVGLVLQGAAISLVAVVLATGLQALVVPVFPLTVRVPASAYWQLPALAVVVAVLASQAALRRVRRCDPITAFAGP